ncbi:lipoprotein LipL36 [Leptospira interrogans]|nr:lipoprotein LipL36 [Leptospira interrogans]KAA1269048.1 lipoprotein LipL36 [Leptospira interrogans serovar Weerasinghe]ULG81016.1 lipoprotein LipL36 [Leptospira interrogans]ULG91451.1 lipoprotein LipL36 [Leptospira interrogans]UML68640.1 lipoprotein LipL36 [Leptospira interrogans]UML71961.1 lipoprotein LipL36 [Leptospira interrogans]
MRRNIMKIAAVAALTVALTACKGDDDDDDVVMLALLYLADQTSGNCVTLSKADGNGDGIPTYTATGTTRPKGACSNAYNVQVIVNNPEAVVASVQASYQAAKVKTDAAGSNCAVVSTYLQSQSNNATTLKVQQSLATNTCLVSGTGWNLTPLTFGGFFSVDPAYLGKTVYACSSEKAKENLLVGLNINSYSTIAGSVATDMATNLAYQQKLTAVSASNFKWTADAAAKGRLINVTELTTVGKSGATIVAFNSIQNAAIAAVGAGNVAGALAAASCAKDLLAKEPEEVQKIAFALYDPANNFKGAVTGGPGALVDSTITTAQAQSVTEVLFSSLTCQYGDFDEEATGNKQTVGTEANVKINGTCPATYPKY